MPRPYRQDIDRHQMCGIQVALNSTKTDLDFQRYLSLDQF